MDEDFDRKELANASVAEVPWYFRLGRFMSKHNIRGGHRLMSQVRRRGLLDQLAIYSLGELEFRVPLWRPCNEWLEDDVRDYEAAFMRILGETVCQLPGPTTFIDCGADIGTVSAHVVARCKNIRRVVAFEPNPAAFWVLAENLRAMGLETEAHNVAVGDAVRVDEIAISQGTSCAIKIDVDGAEAAVVAGAARTIREAGHVVVAFGAHAPVAVRRGRDPNDVMQALLALRPDFTFVVDTLPAREIDPSRRLFDQMPQKIAYNVIARSSAPA